MEYRVFFAGFAFMLLGWWLVRKRGQAIERVADRLEHDIYKLPTGKLDRTWWTGRQRLAAFGFLGFGLLLIVVSGLMSVDDIG